jgi:putative ABC transport system permease protein
MKKSLLLARSNILRHKSASLSLFVIIMIASLLVTIGLTVMTGLDRNFDKVVNETNMLHSAFLVPRDMYNDSYEEVLKNDSRVSQYEITSVMSPSGVGINYGGQIDLRVVILNMDDPYEISPLAITEEDLRVSRETAIYMPEFARGLGYQVGDPFTMVYKNKPIEFTVAGFFETKELASINIAGVLKFFVPEESYENLKMQYFGESVWITARFFDMSESKQFNSDFAEQVDENLTGFNLVLDVELIKVASVYPALLLAAILIVFALMIVLISMFVIRFRISSNIEDTMHEIGVLKASGYTSSQIVASYLAEYGLLSVPAAILGVILSVPAFSFAREAMISASAFPWTFGTEIGIGIITVIIVVAIVIVMTLRTCRKIKELPPVEALRGGIAANNFRKNFFSLSKGAGKVDIRLGLKNMFVFMKTYAMVGVIIMIMSVATIFVTVLYQNIGLEPLKMAEMAGIEMADYELKLTRHTDADALAAELEQMPEVRKTSMIDMGTLFKVDGIEVIGKISDDFSKMESIATHDGRFPEFDNEVAITKLFSNEIGKEIGDSVIIEAAGVSQEYIISGFFSAASNAGRIASITLEGYQKLDPGYERDIIDVYLNEGASKEGFLQSLKQDVGVINVYKQDEDSRYSATKAVAEEKISNYIEHYNIDSVEYAVIYEGEMILGGSSAEYQVENIVDLHEYAMTNIGTFSTMATLIVQVVLVLSILIIILIISITMRGIMTKRYRELGAMKAVGFTTKQLSNQLSISFMPCAAAGAVLGCVIGVLVAGPLLLAIFSATGAYGMVFSVNPVMTILVGVLMIVVAFAASKLAARRIRNISPYELITERAGSAKETKTKKIRKVKKSRVVTSVVVMLCVLTVVNPLCAYGEAALSGAGNVDAASSVAPHEAGKLYGIGSVSKVFAAAAVMKLVDQGKVSLDTPITEYIVGFEMADERYKEITPRMLLNHSSGLKGYTEHNAIQYGDTSNDNHEGLLKSLRSQTLKQDPGNTSAYSNDSFTLAEILVERVSGISYTEFVEQNFAAPLGLENIVTAQSNFDRQALAPIYSGNSQMQFESINVIGTGGIQATMEDLCRFSTIFMDSADGSILSKESTDEMAKNQYKNEMTPSDADSFFKYGLGWDATNAYPFSKYGIKALAKGGASGMYHTALLVLPKYNITCAVSSSGKDALEFFVAQEILLSVLEEEGLLPEREPDKYDMSTLAANTEGATVPEGLKSLAGIYDAGIKGTWNIEFTDTSFIMTPIMVRNERPIEYFYIGDKTFVAHNDFVSYFKTSLIDLRGAGYMTFTEDGYLVMQNYEALPGLSYSAVAMPFAKKHEENPVSASAQAAWESRNEKEYLLVSERYSSSYYLTSAVAKTLADERTPGYVGAGIYKNNGKGIVLAKITDEKTAKGYQSIPGDNGFGIDDLSVTTRNGAEYLMVNDAVYIDAASVKNFSELGSTVTIEGETVWVDINSGLAGKTISIDTPENGAWFVYDKDMKYVASSLEKHPRKTIILPENGRLAFAGENGASFGLIV